MLTVPETTTGLKPEFIAVVDKIYRINAETLFPQFL